MRSPLAAVCLHASLVLVAALCLTQGLTRAMMPASTPAFKHAYGVGFASPRAEANALILQEGGVHAPRNSLFRRYFRRGLDTDGDGYFTPADLRAFIVDNLHMEDTDEEIEPALLLEAFAELDTDGDGRVSFAEFRDRFLWLADAQDIPGGLLEVPYGSPEEMLARPNGGHLLDDGDLSGGRLPSSFASAFDGLAPEGVHLAFGATPGDMTVIWTTFASTNDTIVQIGQTPGQYGLEYTGEEYTYNSGVTGWDGFLHKVRVQGLLPGSRYYYRVGSGDVSDPSSWSQEFTFETMPLPGSTDRPMKYALYGDMGTFMPFGGHVTEALVKWHARDPFDMILHVGDISYAGTGSDREWQGIWDIFARQTEPLAANIPYMTTIGNHEKYDNFTAFRARFEMPEGSDNSAAAAVPGFFNSFDHGLVHFVSVCSEPYAYEYVPGSQQYRWLEADLARANTRRHLVPWVVVSVHRPMYGTADGGRWTELQAALEPLLRKYKVDLLIAGHMHLYERTLPVYQDTPVNQYPDLSVYTDPQAPVHLTIGTAGAMVHDRWETNPDWLAFRQRSYGFAQMTVHSAHELEVVFVSNQAEGEADRFSIVRTAGAN